jgi:hypothetical protein
MDDQGTSYAFINENFDDVVCQQSKESSNENENCEETICKQLGPAEKTSELEVQSYEKEIEEIIPIETVPIEIEPQYDEPIFIENKYDQPMLHIGQDSPPVVLDFNDSPTLLDLDIKATNRPDMFSEATPLPTFLNGKSIEATASSSPGKSPEDNNDHRPLPDVIGDEGHENMYDLQVNITSRAKHMVSKTDSYITYKIETNSLRPRHLYELSQYVVWRRYSDFEWLHDQLEKTHSTLILPPLPGKQVIRYLDHLSETFLEERQHCLEQFLVRLASHPFYSYDNNLKMFLTVDEQTFSAHVAETSAGNRFFGMMTSSVKHATTSLRLKNPDPDFMENGKYFSALNEKMGVLERIETRLNSDRKQLSNSCCELAAMCISWANSENYLSNGIRKLSGVYEANASSLHTLDESNAYSFQIPLRMYQLYSNSGVSAIKRRDALQLKYETASDERDKKRILHEEAVQTGKTEKVTKIANDLEKIGVVTEQAQDQLAHANEQLRVDIEKWKESKDEDLKDMFLNWSSNHIHYHERMFHEWEELLGLLKDLNSDDLIS